MLQYNQLRFVTVLRHIQISSGALKCICSFFFSTAYCNELWHPRRRLFGWIYCIKWPCCVLVLFHFSDWTYKVKKETRNQLFDSFIFYSTEFLTASRAITIVLEFFITHNSTWYQNQNNFSYIVATAFTCYRHSVRLHEFQRFGRKVPSNHVHSLRLYFLEAVPKFQLSGSLCNVRSNCTSYVFTHICFQLHFKHGSFPDKI